MLTRLSLAAALAAIALVPHAAQAQARRADLPIPLPPGAAIQIDLDGRDNDVLGMVKDLIGGAHFGPNADAPTGAAKTANAVVITRPGPPSVFFGAPLAAVLQNIHHLHLVSFAPPPARPGGTKGDAVFDALTFYDKPFSAQGGHRTLFYNNGPRVALYGFDQTHSFAAVVDTGGVVDALRADGYPDMAVLGGITHINLGGGEPAKPAP